MDSGISSLPTIIYKFIVVVVGVVVGWCCCAVTTKSRGETIQSLCLPSFQQSLWVTHINFTGELLCIDFGRHERIHTRVLQVCLCRILVFIAINHMAILT